MEVQGSHLRENSQPETLVCPPTSETLFATAAEYLAVFKTLDPSSITHVQTQDYTHEFAPQSANLPGPFSLDEFAQFLSSLRKVINSFNMTARDTWVNPSLRQVVIRACSAPTFWDEVKAGGSKIDWSFEGEYIFILHLDDKGRKVRKVLEFVDSKGTERLMALIAQAMSIKG